jgi:uncharacterized protein
MKSKQEVVAILKKELPKLRTLHHVSRIALFGSYARGEQRRGSDIDLLVEFEEPVGFIEFMNLEFYLKKLLGVRVDLVTPDALKPITRPRILKEAVYVSNKTSTKTHGRSRHDEEHARILKERLEFILIYVSRIKQMTNRQWSAQQAAFIDAVLSNASNMPLTKEKYLALVDGNGKR